MNSISLFIQSKTVMPSLEVGGGGGGGIKLEASGRNSDSRNKYVYQDWLCFEMVK